MTIQMQNNDTTKPQKPTNQGLWQRALVWGLVACCAVAWGCAPRRDFVRNIVHVERADGFELRAGQKVAVMTFTGSVSGKAVSDLVSIELLKKGIDVIERDSFDRVVAELRRTEAGVFNEDMSDQEVIQQLGKVTGADIIVVGEAWSSSPDTIRLKEVDQGQLLAGAALLILLPIGLIVMGSAEDTTDYGERSPHFASARSEIAVRAFSTRDGKVIWWGSAETDVNGGYGDDVGMLDYLRLPVAELTRAMTDKDYQAKVQMARDEDIKSVFGTPQRR